MYQGKYASPAPAPAKKRKGFVGTIVFYSFLGTLVLAVCITLGIAMSALNDWLVSFEASQPDTRSREIFAQHFSDPDWEAIFTLSGTQEDALVTKSGYRDFMEEKVGDSPLTYIETSAGLSGDKKFIVRLGNEKVATFTLEDRSAGADIPDWQLGKVEIFYSPEPPPVINLDIRVITIPGYQVLVNGQPLDDSHVVRLVTTAAEDYLPEGVHGYRLCELYADGYPQEPQVEVLDPAGKPVALSFDQATRTYSHPIPQPQLGDAEAATLVTAAQTYCRYMIGAAKKSDLQGCFDQKSTIYKTITSTATWMQNYTGYNFGEETITGYYRYSDSLYSAQVSLTLNVTRKDGSVKEYHLSSTFFLETQADGKERVSQMINADPQEKTTLVRLSYMADDQLVESVMVDANATTLTPPAVSVPAGKTFAGWCTRQVAENGDITMSLMFLPGQDGTVRLAAGQTLEPMTLHAMFTTEEP